MFVSCVFRSKADLVVFVTVYTFFFKNKVKTDVQTRETLFLVWKRSVCSVRDSFKENFFMLLIGQHGFNVRFISAPLGMPCLDNMFTAFLSYFLFI